MILINVIMDTKTFIGDEVKLPIIIAYIQIKTLNWNALIQQIQEIYTFLFLEITYKCIQAF